MWAQEKANFEGTYYLGEGSDQPTQRRTTITYPTPDWGGGEKVTLRLVAQYAEACNIGGDTPTIKRKLAVLKQHCEELGREYESITKLAKLA